jgi:hypothetical protein
MALSIAVDGPPRREPRPARVAWLHGNGWVEPRQ